MHHGPLRHSSLPVSLSRRKRRTVVRQPLARRPRSRRRVRPCRTHSACGDLTTAVGVNRALAQVFRLLAQRRISRQEAATFGHLAQLLLRTISLARAESVSAPAAGARPNATSPVILSSGESHQQDELSPVNKVERERKITPEPAPERTHPPHLARFPNPSPPRPHKNGASAPPDVVCNSSEINTYKNVELKALKNEHLQENPSGKAPQDTTTEILPAQPPSSLHQEPQEPQDPQEPQGPPSEQHGSRLENTKGAGVRLGIGHDGARRR